MLLHRTSIFLLIVLLLPFAPSSEPAYAQTGCSVDLMLVLDGSGSIQPDDFTTMKNFANSLVQSFEIGPRDANVGIVQFADSPSLYLELSDDKEQVLSRIRNMSQFGERTNIADGIDMAQDAFAERRDGIPRVIIILTDGLHNIPGSNPIASADIARSEGTYILSVAVGDFDLTELISISGGPENVITVGNFDSLALISDILLNNTCAFVSVPNPTAPATDDSQSPTDEPDQGQSATAVPDDTTDTQVDNPTPQGPRRTHIAFASDRDGDSEIFIINADGTDERQITFNTANDDKPSWSKDGRRIAFESNQDGPDFDIFVMDADGNNITKLTDSQFDDYGPAWSPDGSQIAFHSNRAGSIEIFVMNADGSNVRQLTQNSVATDRSPTWSPDGTRIMYYSDVSGGREINIVDIQSGSITRLTDNAYYDGQPDWSLNGTQAVFASTRSATNPDIFVMRIDGTSVTRLTEDQATDDDPVWSPDGRQIAFESTRGGSFDIWIMNADGTGLTQLTDDPGRDWSADWIWVAE